MSNFEAQQKPEVDRTTQEIEEELHRLEQVTDEKPNSEDENLENPDDEDEDPDDEDDEDDEDIELSPQHKKKLMKKWGNKEDTDLIWLDKREKSYYETHDIPNDHINKSAVITLCNLELQEFKTLCEGEDVKKIKVGDKITYLFWGVNSVEIDGEKYWVIPETDEFILFTM